MVTIISSATAETKFTITDIKLYVPVELYQLKVMQYCMNNYKLALKEQLIETNINQKFLYKPKISV